MPVRPSGSLGRNHDAQSGITRGSVDMGEGGFFLRASLSSVGETRYEEKDRRGAEAIMNLPASLVVAWMPALEEELRWGNETRSVVKMAKLAMATQANPRRGDVRQAKLADADKEPSRAGLGGLVTSPDDNSPAK